MSMRPYEELQAESQYKRASALSSDGAATSEHLNSSRNSEMLAAATKGESQTQTPSRVYVRVYGLVQPTAVNEVQKSPGGEVIY